MADPLPSVLLTTDRLVLRRFTLDDVDLLLDLDSDPAVMHFITAGAPTPRIEIREMLQAWLAYYEQPAPTGFWAAEERGSGAFVGWFHLRPGPDHSPQEPELGYRLRRAYWGRGLATEGSTALVDMSFRSGGATRVVAETMAVHTASRRVMEKVGMSLVREFQADWPVRIPGDEHGDVEYALDRAAWSARIAGMAQKVTGPRSYFPSIEKTYGRPADDWLVLLDEVRDRKHMEQVAWLKSEHGIGHGHANALVAVYRSENGL